jgi:hypothetical protein
VLIRRRDVRLRERRIDPYKYPAVNKKIGREEQKGENREKKPRQRERRQNKNTEERTHNKKKNQKQREERLKRGGEGEHSPAGARTVIFAFVFAK